MFLQNFRHPELIQVITLYLDKPRFCIWIWAICPDHTPPPPPRSLSGSATLGGKLRLERERCKAFNHTLKE